MPLQPSSLAPALHTHVHAHTLQDARAEATPGGGGRVLVTAAVPWHQASCVSLAGSTTDVHTVASLLKLYLRELPEPVVPFARYEDFLSCAQLLTKDEREVSGSQGPILGGRPVRWWEGCVESGHKISMTIHGTEILACSLLCVWRGESWSSLLY